MTTEQLLADTTFLALCEYWRLHNRCPLPMGDYLREQGWEEAAAVADWAATYPDRRLFGDDDQGGPTPLSYDNNDTMWCFLVESRYGEGIGECADVLPVKGTDNDDSLLSDFRSTFVDSVLLLLQHYRPPKAL